MIVSRSAYCQKLAKTEVDVGKETLVRRRWGVLQDDLVRVKDEVKTKG